MFLTAVNVFNGCGLDCHHYSSTSSHFGFVGNHNGLQCIVKSRKWTERKSKYSPDSFHVYTSSHSCGVLSHWATGWMLLACHLWHMRVYTRRAQTDRLDSRFGWFFGSSPSHTPLFLKECQKTVGISSMSAQVRLHLLSFTSQPEQLTCSNLLSLCG